MNDNRKKALELYAKQIEEGLPFGEEFLKDKLADSNIANVSLHARNLSEEALAHQVLKNTGIPIPDPKKSSYSKMTDFYQRLMEERYPELKSYVIPDDLESQGIEGFYSPKEGFIGLDEGMAKKQGLAKSVGTLFHEGGHQYDDQILKQRGEPLSLSTLRKAKESGVDLKNMDPTQVYELYGAKHHAQIPKLREGTFGLGALKSYLKSGTFKGLAPVLTKGAVAGAGGLASLAAEAADAVEEGSALEEEAMQREAQDRKFRKAVGEDAYQKSQQLMQDIGPADLLDKDAQKLQFRTLRKKLK